MIIIKFFDLFAGIGGFRLGMEKAGHECVGWCEKDKFAQKSYKAIHNTKGEWFQDDATKINPKEMPEFNILCAGFPCQSFSIAGNRKGFEDTRGTMFFEIARIVREKLPKILFLENVKGLLNHSNGETFHKILKTLDELGYDAEWQVLNSKNFGVPQNRERVFIIGHLRGEPKQQIFPIRKVAKEIEIGVIGTTQNPKAKGTNSRHWVHNTEGIVGAIGASDYKQPKQILQVGNIVDDSEINFKNPQRGRVYNPAGISPILNTVGGGGLEPKIVVRACLTPSTPSRLNKRQNGRRFKEDGEPSFTLTKQDIHGIAVKEIDYKIRKLTPLEYFRLQGFPDSAFYAAEKENSDTQLYRQAGNSVTVNVVHVIAKKFKIKEANRND